MFLINYLRRYLAQKTITLPKPSTSKTGKIQADPNNEYKMVLLIRMDLEMSKGKIASQCCHATLAAYKEMQKRNPEVLELWEMYGQAKVTLRVSNEDQIDKAKEVGLCAKSIKDAGRTQIASGSRTVLAIGPGPVKLVDCITGHLKLY